MHESSESSVISQIIDQRSEINVTPEKISFTLTVSSENISCATVAKSSSNQHLVPNENIVLSGNSPDCQLQLSPLANIIDETTITLSVMDEGRESIESFNFTTYNP